MRRFGVVDARTGWLLAVMGALAPACGGGTSDGGTGGMSGAATGATGGGGTGGGGTGGTSNKFPCKNPTPIMVKGKDTGVDSCDGNMVRRRSATTCPTALPRPEACSATQMNCTTDADCKDKAHGMCNFRSGGGGAPSSCGCDYGCVTDADCPTNSSCLCGDPVGRCVPAKCKTSADCQPGFDCLAAAGACAPSALSCQTPSDECGSSLDCSPNNYCGEGPQGNMVCKPDGCGGLGRPFLVDGIARLASAEQHDDYLRELAPNLSDLDAAERQALADHWTSIGLMEHASIAAFARFTMQLLGLGAPAHLVSKSNAAQADETRHAEIAFSLASAYAAAPRGPGVLDLSRALLPVEAKQVVADVIREGCIGETLACVEAEHGANAATDPVLQGVLSRIASDESRHAELAWHFIAWMLRKQPELEPFVRREFARAISEKHADSETARDTPDPGKLKLGIVEGHERVELHRDILNRLIRPSIEALFATHQIERLDGVFQQAAPIAQT